jgi:hypothetical protein
MKYGNPVDNLSLVLQALSLQILFQDYNNADLMNELQQQDENYLKKIIEQNEEIIALLKEGGKYGARYRE